MMIEDGGVDDYDDDDDDHLSIGMDDKEKQG